ncbi:MAG TPA: polysaccharide deacetylase family protein [Bradyrhizobium sp.]|jgi:peptidoglycan/xylan/chitin deacetylase (PgdA/CDA1 family)|nr:polysaccharide deacetylase family protein [Bradyrhizobium sp.]
MLRGIKQATLTGLKQLGAFNLCLGSAWRRQRLLILCYHGISLDDEHQWNPGLYMQGADFEARLELLAKGGFVVLALDEAIERLYKHDLPPASVVITVDDGHYDFYEQAYPRLKKYGYPVTVYLSSFYTTYNRPIFDGFCSYLLWKARHSVMPAREEIGLDRPFDLRNEAGRSGAWRALKQFTLRERLKAHEKDQVLQSLAEHLRMSYGDLLARRILHNLNPSEVSLLAKDGVRFELHTHRHRTPLDRDLFDREIRDNRACIVEMTGVNPTHFCYPSGVHEPEFLPWLAESGVVSATTCDRGLNSSRANPLVLSRILDHSGLRPIELEGWLTGCSAWLPHRTSSSTGETG